MCSEVIVAILTLGGKNSIKVALSNISRFADFCQTWSLNQTTNSLQNHLLLSLVIVYTGQWSQALLMQSLSAAMDSFAGAGSTTVYYPTTHARLGGVGLCELWVTSETRPY